MRKLIFALLSVCISLPALAQGGMTNITASHLESDMSGTLLTGKLCLTPVLGTNPTAFTANGGAQVLQKQVCYPITNGALNISVPDTALAQPSGTGYKVAFQLANGFPLYSYAQPIYPTGATWSLDSWTPTQTANITSTTVNYSALAPSGNCGTAPAIWYTATNSYSCINQAWTLLPGATGGAQADWTAVTGPSVVLHKPTLAAVATSGSYTDLSNKPVVGVLNRVAPSGDTTGATDVASINASCTANGNAQLLPGAYYINAAITLTAPCRILGAGSTTIINNKGLTNNWFRISYDTPWQQSPWVYPTSTNQSEIAYMQFAQVGTPTAGYIFNIGTGVEPTSGSTYHYTMNVHIHDTVANNAWGGAYFGDDELYAFVEHNMWRNFVGGGAIYYNAHVGSGDNHITDNEFSGLTNSGIIIAQSDTQMFAHDKLNGSGIKFTGAGLTWRVQFTDMSVETGISQPCAYDFGTGSAPIDTQINGGEVLGFTTLICHPSNATNLAFTLDNASATSDYAAGLVTNNGWKPVPGTNGLVNASLPTFTPAAGSYIGTQNISIACTTGTPYYQLGSGAVTQYTSPVAVTVSATLSSGCYGTALTTPGTASATYTIGSFQDQALFAGSSGTLLSAYTTAAGKTFALYPSGNGTVIPQLNGSGSMVLPSGTDATFGDSLDTLTPSSANYTVGMTCTRVAGSPIFGLYARAASGSDTNYIVQYAGNVNNYQLYSQNSGTVVQMGSSVPFTWSTGATHTVTLTVNGTTISAAIDGTTILGPFTNSVVSAAGQGGFRITGGSDVTCTNFYIQ